VNGEIFSIFNRVASLALAINYPCRASVPHSLVNGLKNLLSIAAETEVTFKEAEKMKEFLKDPSKFAASIPAAAAVPAAAKPAAAKKEPEKKEESESDEDMGLGLFD